MTGMTPRRTAGPDAARHRLAGHGITGHRLAGHGTTGHGATAHAVTGHRLAELGVTGHGVTARDVTGHGLAEHGATGHGVTGHGVTGHGVTGHGTTKEGTEAHGMTRRGLVAALALIGGALLAHPARAHTPYRQWVVYRKKHLLLGSHRDDAIGYGLAKQAAEHLVTHLPTSKARVARAPAASRLASLIATDQLDVAVLEPDVTAAMRTGSDTFAAYGKIDLKTLLLLADGRALVAHARFSPDHAELVAQALIGTDIAPLAAQRSVPPAPWHSGVRALLQAHR